MRRQQQQRRRRWLTSAGNAWGGQRRRASAAPAPVRSDTGGVVAGLEGVHTHSRARASTSSVTHCTARGQDDQGVALAKEM